MAALVFDLVAFYRAHFQPSFDFATHLLHNWLVVRDLLLLTPVLSRVLYPLTLQTVYEHITPVLLFIPTNGSPPPAYALLTARAFAVALVTHGCILFCQHAACARYGCCRWLTFVDRALPLYTAHAVPV